MANGRSKIFLKKLTKDDVKVIRASTESATILGTRYGVSAAYIRKVRNRKTWRETDGTPN